MSATTAFRADELIRDSLVFRFEPRVFFCFKSFSQCSVEPRKLHELRFSQVILTFWVLDGVLDNLTNRANRVFY